jgi:hypothetical protein
MNTKKQRIQNPKSHPLSSQQEERVDDKDSYEGLILGLPV